jgi:hypothetical protein
VGYEVPFGIDGELEVGLPSVPTSVRHFPL